MLSEKQRAQTAIQQQRFRKRQQQARRREQTEKGLPPMPAISTMPGNARWHAAIHSAEALLSQVVDEMTTYYDERSEAWQEGDAGTEYAERLEAVKTALDDLEQLLV